MSSCIVTVPMCKYQSISCCTASFKDLVKVVQENFTNQTADVLAEEQPPLDYVTVSQERELHKPNSRTERWFSFHL